MGKTIQAGQDCAQREALLESVIEAVGDPVMAIGLDHRVLWMNSAALQAIDHDGPAEGLWCHDVLFGRGEPCGHDQEHCSLSHVRATGRTSKFIHNRADAGGVIRQFEVIASPLRDRSGELLGVVKTMRDITEHHRMLSSLHEKGQLLEAQARKDPLTGLANREMAMERVEHAIRLAHRNRNLLGLLFIDLDRFKIINDSHGHAVGDQVLQTIGKRLTRTVREGDMVARLGGDEFIVLLDRLDAPEGAAVVARKLLACLREPLSLKMPTPRTFHVGASIGIGIYPRDGEDGETLLRSADIAMYRAKRCGAGKPEFFSGELACEDRARQALEHSLRRALEGDGDKEFFLLYQPVVDLIDGSIDKVEALLRWNHPEQGIMAPGRFLAVAEESGLIKALDEWVLLAACGQYAEWRRQGCEPPRIAVNLSARQIHQQDFPDRLAAILDLTDCPGDALEIELTEACLMKAPQTVLTVLGRLGEMGVAISVDDFGAGYTSLNHLKRLPISHLKLDRGLVSRLPAGGHEAAVARAVLALGASLQFKVAAKGIETEAQRNFLVAEGCRHGQGYLYSQPVAAGELAKRLSP